MVKLVLALVAGAAADQWSDFKAKFGREYNGEEDDHRRQIFMNNLEFIDASNAKGHTYTLGVGPFADLTAAEFKELLGFNPEAQDVPTLGTVRALSGEAFADSVDWTTKGAVTPVKNQGHCGSCWAFSATGSLESGYQIASGDLVQLSEQQQVDCDGFPNMGCKGGRMDNAIKWAMKNDLCTEESYAYTATGGLFRRCKSSGCTVGVKSGAVTGAVKVGDSDEDLKKAVSQQPVAIAIEADQEVFQHYTTGVITGDCGTSLDHGVLLVGYGSDSDGDYWKVKNSWSDTWGEDGYVRIGQGKNLCGINMMPFYPSFDSSSVAV